MFSSEMGTTPNLPFFLLSLQWVFLPDISSREHLALPLALQVDYRAACFCHQKLVEVGFVCSVCLSSEWASECVCVHAWAQCHGIVNGFSCSILPVNSNMLHLPVSLTTVAPSCKCYRKITNSLLCFKDPLQVGYPASEINKAQEKEKQQTQVQCKCKLILDSVD